MSTPRDYEADREDLEAWLAFEPDEIPDDLTDEEIDQMREDLEAREYWSYSGHPSLTPQQRNPSL
tara:strand:+ start:63 stop:257 length:195 start_codon:yes stop_codon:yes gene_type:complete